jgi:hypothetical protein
MFIIVNHPKEKEGFEMANISNQPPSPEEPSMFIMKKPLKNNI